MRNVKDLIKIISFFSIVLFVGCYQNNHNLKIDSSRLIIKMQERQVVNKSEYGEIIYKSKIMDTLTLKNTDDRKIIFRYGIFKKQHSIKDLESKTTIVFGTSNDSVIPFHVQIDKIGEFYIEGYIQDSIYLHDYYKNGKSRIITDKIKISKKIRVINK